MSIDLTDPGREPWDPEDDVPQPLIEYSADVMGENMGRHAGYVLMSVQAGPRPPAGEFARWKRHVQVTVSPTGRSARVWVDGVEILPPDRKSSTQGDTHA